MKVGKTMTIGQRIKEQRLTNKLTQEELAAKINTTKQTIYKYENEIVTNIPLDRLEAIAKALGVTSAYLMGWEETKKTPVGENNKDMELTEKDERDISRRLDKMLSELDSQGSALMFDGEPLDDESRELLISALENSIRMAKIINKRKYTPKKYRKDHADEISSDK